MKKHVWQLGLGVVALGTLAIASACVSSKNGTTPEGIVLDSGPPPVSGGSTGSLGVVVINGVQKLYLPTTKTNAAGNNVVSVVNVGLDGNGVNGVAALITDIDLGVSDDHPAMAGGDTSMILVGSGLTRTLWVIDPQTDKLVKTIQLDPSTQLTEFSTDDGYMNGIAIDSAHRKAYISIWNGFAVFDMNSMTITSNIVLNPTENFAFDNINQKLYAPFYNCEENGREGDAGPPKTCTTTTVSGTDGGTEMTAGLNVVDLTDGTVYTYQDPTNQRPDAPFGADPDSAGVDPATQLVFIPDEFGAQFAVDFSKATFDKATLSVTAPHELISNQQFDGVAIETTKHYAFWEHEFADTIAVMDVASLAITGFDAGDDPNAAIAGFVSASMPSTPVHLGTGQGESGWSNSGDPHGVAVATGVKDGKPVAFLVDYPNNDWIARIDLGQMASLKGSNGDAGGPIILAPEDVTPAITYLDALTPVGTVSDAGSGSD